MENTRTGIQLLDDLKARLDTLHDEREALTTAIQALSSVYDRKPTIGIPDFLVDRDAPAEPEVNISRLNIDFSVAKTMTQKVFLVFQAIALDGHLVNVGKVAEYMYGKNETKGTLKSMRSTVSHIISEYSDCFERVKDGTYKYIASDEKALVESVGDMGDSEQIGSCDIARSDTVS